MDWDAKPAADKTWDNFKTHFADAQRTLKNIRGPTMQQAGYHHANALATQIRTDLETQLANRDNELMSMLTSISDNNSGNSDPPGGTEGNTPPPATESLNATTQNTQLEILRLLRDMQTELRNQRSTNNGNEVPPTNQGRGGGAGRGGIIRRNRKTPDNARFPRPQTDKYCWTHGGCNHTSGEC